MTAFDNIKVNNWPATSNEFEDFLVLKQPLNDTASLTESLPVVAGSKELFPKRTLANTGVSTLAAGSDWNASSGGSNYNGTWDNVFNGAAIADSSTQGASYWMYAYNQTMHVNLREPISGQIEILAGLPGSSGSGTHSITLSAGSTDVVTTTLTAAGASNYQWYDFGNRSNIDKITVQGGDPGVSVWAVRLNNIVLVNPTGGPKKHYDSNASFNGTSAFLYHEPDPLFNLGTDDWAIECWFKKDSLSSTGQLFQLGLEVYYTNNIEIAVNTNGAIQYHMYGNSTSQEGFTSSNSAITAGTWHHMACTRQGTTFRGFLDGVQLGSWTKAANWNVGSSTAAHNSPTIGARTNGSRGNMHLYFDGVIQDFRIYRGTPKYTANFTPPGAILG